MGGLQGLLGPAIPSIAKQLNVADTALGWAFSVRAGGYICGSLIISRVDEERGPSKMMIMAVAGVLASVVNLCMPYVTVMLAFLALCFCQGIGLSIISTLGNIVLLE
jgi:MFS family permease